MFKPCPSPRFYFSQFLIVFFLLGFAYYLEHGQGLLPCALCELQRLVFALLGFLFLVCALLPLRKYSQILMNSLISLLALFGIVLAGRQVWLQYLPLQQYPGVTCDAGLSYLLKIMSWLDALMVVFGGGPECAKISWQFLHLSIAGWALLWFLGFFILSFYQLLSWLFKKGS